MYFYVIFLGFCTDIGEKFSRAGINEGQYSPISVQ